MVRGFRLKRARAFAAGAFVSMVVHGLAVLVLLRLPSARELDRRTHGPYVVDLEPAGEPAGVPGASRSGSAPTHSARALPGASKASQNIDANDPGERGDGIGSRDAIRLMHRADGVVLFDSPLNNLASAQTQRIRTASDRATLERRRATPNPEDAPFVASGPGRHAERRLSSASDAAAGARRAPVASVEGAHPSRESHGASVLEGEVAGRSSQGRSSRLARANDAVHGAQPSPGVGILGGEGNHRSEAARVATARPAVDRGPAATQTDGVDPRVRDRSDAELLARDMMQSWVESTTRSGTREGDGRGGAGGGGAPGSGGGRDEGGRAAAYGPGDGRYDALDTNDARYRRWFLVQRRRVHDALRFPRERALAMDQGVTIYSVTVRRDGTLASEPTLVRSSGFDDMDRAALAAIHEATPFSPLPDDLAPDRDELRIRLPIEFSNPMVR